MNVTFSACTTGVNTVPPPPPAFPSRTLSPPPPTKYLIVHIELVANSHSLVNVSCVARQFFSYSVLPYSPRTVVVFSPMYPGCTPRPVHTTDHLHINTDM
jgi:hypothetical protein